MQFYLQYFKQNILEPVSAIKFIAQVINTKTQILETIKL